MTAPHPAPFSDSIIERFALIVAEYAGARTRVRVLDPFAGVGGIHKIPELMKKLTVSPTKVDTVGIELEPNWASAHSRTRVGSALKLPFRKPSFDFVMTSPCYGNRMADHHNAKDASKRITYRHYYGENLSNGSSAVMQWGNAYREFHLLAWIEAQRVLKHDGLFVVNISNHIRHGSVMPVVEWHLQTLLELGLRVERVEQVVTPRMKNGANADLRVPFEHILVMKK